MAHGHIENMAKMLICIGSLVKAASKYYDGENRPYEFGYNIEGNQHRHEKKDENGIITGEFGFITADGVYHVTAYATDENGNFKILFMKNIKIGLPGEQGSMPVPKELQPELPVRNPQKSKSYPTVILDPSDTPSCSGCSIPKKKNENADKIPSPGGSRLSPASVSTVEKNSLDSRTGSAQGSSGLGSSSRPSQGSSSGLSQSPRGDSKSPTLFKPLSQKIDGPNQLSSRGPAATSKQGKTPASNQGSRSTGLSPEEQTSTSEQGTKPAFSQDSENGDKEGKLRPIARDMNQLGESLTGLLYKFNYTVGYHGHHEEGDIVGAKDGGYFFVGRDGFKRTVDYQANEFGYQPHIAQQDAIPEDIPKPETEKEKGLKGYEFKWFNQNKL